MRITMSVRTLKMAKMMYSMLILMHCGLTTVGSHAALYWDKISGMRDPRGEGYRTV